MGVPPGRREQHLRSFLSRVFRVASSSPRPPPVISAPALREWARNALPFSSPPGLLRRLLGPYLLFSVTKIKQKTLDIFRISNAFSSQISNAPQPRSQGFSKRPWERGCMPRTPLATISYTSRSVGPGLEARNSLTFRQATELRKKKNPPMHRHWINKKLSSLASLWRVTIRLSHSGCGDSFSHSSTSLVFKFDVHVTRALHQYSVTYQTWRISGGDDARVLNNTEVTWKSRNGPNRFRVPSRRDH